MDIATHLLILIGLGCIIMGIILLSQEPILKEKEKDPEAEPVKEKRPESYFDEIKPVTTRSDFIWMQDTREVKEQVRPYPVF